MDKKFGAGGKVRLLTSCLGGAMGTASLSLVANFLKIDRFFLQ